MTLIEIMIVILLIGLVSGVLIYNFQGSLDQGKQFKSEQGARQVKSILVLEMARGKSAEDVVHDWKTIVMNSSLANKPQELIKDGYGKEYSVSLDEKGDILVLASK